MPHRWLRPRSTFGRTGCGPGHKGRDGGRTPTELADHATPAAWDPSCEWTGGHRRTGPHAVAGLMKPIDEQHIAEPGLVVLDITGADEDTVRAVMAALDEY